MSGAGIGRLAGRRGKRAYPCEGAVQFSCTDTSTLRERRRGSCLSTLAMSSPGPNKTPFSIESSERLLMISHRVAGAFASDNKSCIARRAERSPVLRYTAVRRVRRWG